MVIAAQTDPYILHRDPSRVRVHVGVDGGSRGDGPGKTVRAQRSFSDAASPLAVFLPFVEGRDRARARQNIPRAEHVPLPVSPRVQRAADGFFLGVSALKRRGVLVTPEITRRERGVPGVIGKISLYF